MAFSFKNTKKNIFKTEEDDEDFKNNNFFVFVKEILIVLKLETIVI